MSIKYLEIKIVPDIRPDIVVFKTTVQSWSGKTIVYSKLCGFDIFESVWERMMRDATSIIRDEFKKVNTSEITAEIFAKSLADKERKETEGK